MSRPRKSRQLDGAAILRELAADDLVIVNDHRNEPEPRLDRLVAKHGLTRPIELEALERLSEDELDGLCAKSERLHEDGVAGALALGSACRLLLGEPVVLAGTGWMPHSVRAALALSVVDARKFRVTADSIEELDP